MSRHSFAQRSSRDYKNAATVSAQFQPRSFGPVAALTTQAEPQELQKKEENKRTLSYDLTKPFAGSSGQSLFVQPSIQKKSEVTEDFDILSGPLLADLPDVQAKLTVGAVGDKYEQEADAVAARVVDHIHSPKLQKRESVQREEMGEEDDIQMKPLPVGFVQREEISESNKEEDDIQMKPILMRTIGREGGAVSENIESQINNAKGGGHSLEPELQTQLGNAMGADFSGVRVHTDSQSDQLNQSVQAKAFTTGNDVFFRQGEYQPNSRSGQELIAHELTHTIQQGSSPQVQTKSTLIQRVEFHMGNSNADAQSEEPVVIHMGNSNPEDLGLADPQSEAEDAQSEAEDDSKYQELGEKLVEAYRHMDDCVTFLQDKKKTGGVIKALTGLGECTIAIGSIIAIPGGMAVEKAVEKAVSTASDKAQKQHKKPQTKEEKEKEKQKPKGVGEKVKEAGKKAVEEVLPGAEGAYKAGKGIKQIAQSQEDWQRGKGEVAGDFWPDTLDVANELDPALPSKGSLYHDLGNCKPCMWVTSKTSCYQGGHPP